MRRRKGENVKVNGSEDTELHSTKPTPTIENIPLILQPWVYFYRFFISRLSLNLFGLDFTFTIASFLFLSTFRGICHQFMISILGWPAGNLKTDEANSSFVGIFHAILLLTPLLVALLSQPYIPSSKLTDHPQWYRDVVNALLQFTTAYMLQDAIFSYLLFNFHPDDKLTTADICVLGHHVATALYMTSTRLVGAGHLGAMILMYTGEFTNPLQNFRNFSEIGNEVGGLGLPSHLHDLLEITFAVAYTFFRIFVGPACAAHLTYDIAFTKQGRENVPIGITLIWMISAWGVLIGSIPWILETLEMVKVYFGI